MEVVQLEFTDVTEGLPEMLPDKAFSPPLLFISEGELYGGYYTIGGWFYNHIRNLSNSDSIGRAKCGVVNADNPILEKFKTVTHWCYLR